MESHDLIVVGAGPSGLMAAVVVARNGRRVLVIEAQSVAARKLSASGGKRCNLTNTLTVEEFAAECGDRGRFMLPALYHLPPEELRDFYLRLGVETHAPDGKRVFPVTHRASTVVAALLKEAEEAGVAVRVGEEVTDIRHRDEGGFTCVTPEGTYVGERVLVASGGIGNKALGDGGGMHRVARELGLRCTPAHPGMVPLITRETWVAKCRADTIPKVRLEVDIKKSRIPAIHGDCIFTHDGIRGPVVLDAARYITPLLDELDEVPIRLYLDDRDESEWQAHFQAAKEAKPRSPVHEAIGLPESLVREIAATIDTDVSQPIGDTKKKDLNRLASRIRAIPLHVTGHKGWKSAMVTRGGIDRRDIDPKTLAAKKLPGLYFAGEALDVDCPCGGFNLTWAFASGSLVAHDIVGNPALKSDH